jgi:hypothetical protein
MTLLGRVQQSAPSQCLWKTIRRAQWGLSESMMSSIGSENVDAEKIIS